MQNLNDEFEDKEQSEGETCSTEITRSCLEMDDKTFTHEQKYAAKIFIRLIQEKIAFHQRYAMHKIDSFLSKFRQIREKSVRMFSQTLKKIINGSKLLGWRPLKMLCIILTSKKIAFCQAKINECSQSLPLKTKRSSLFIASPKIRVFSSTINSIFRRKLYNCWLKLRSIPKASSIKKDLSPIFNIIRKKTSLLKCSTFMIMKLHTVEQKINEQREKMAQISEDINNNPPNQELSILQQKTEKLSNQLEDILAERAQIQRLYDNDIQTITSNEANKLNQLLETHQRVEEYEKRLETLKQQQQKPYDLEQLCFRLLREFRYKLNLMKPEDDSINFQKVIEMMGGCQFSIIRKEKSQSDQSNFIQKIADMQSLAAFYSSIYGEMRLDKVEIKLYDSYESLQQNYRHNVKIMQSLYATFSLKESIQRIQEELQIVRAELNQN